MTVSSELCASTRVWTGQASVACGFIADDPTHVSVTATSASGEVVKLVRGLHYTSTLTAVTRELVFKPLSMLPQPQTLSLVRKTPAVQSVNLQQTMTYDAETLEQEMDRAAMRDAELQRIFGDVDSRAWRAASGQTPPVIDMDAFPAGTLLMVNGDRQVVPYTGATPAAPMTTPSITDMTTAGRAVAQSTRPPVFDLGLTNAFSATSVPATFKSLFTSGYAVASDMGGATWTEASGTPTHCFARVTSNGRYFVVADLMPTPQMAGIFPGVADVTAGFNLIEASPYQTIYLPPGNYVTTLASVTKNYIGPGVLFLSSGGRDRTILTKYDPTLVTRSQMRIDMLANGISSTSVRATWSFMEIGALLPGIVAWETQAGAAIGVTDTFIREIVDIHAELGFDTICIIQCEYLGFAFFTPSFTWTDQQYGRTLTHWANSTIPGYAPTTDTLQVILDRAAERGIKVVIGTGKDGDEYLSLDLAMPGTTTSSSTSATLAAMSKAARVAQAISRGCQMGQELINRYGKHPAFGGLYISHEPDSIDACAALFKGINKDGGGGFPPLRSYGVPLWVSPGDIDDFPAANASMATVLAKAATIRDYGCDVWAPQDSVGTGEDINNTMTAVPANRLSMLPGYWADFRKLLDAANLVSYSRGTEIEYAANLELWEMSTPNSYTNAFPAAYPRVIEQVAKTADRWDRIGFYGVFPYAMPGYTLSRRLPQNYNAKTDFRTRADALYSGLKNVIQPSGVKRGAVIPYSITRVAELRDDTARTAPASTTTNFNLGNRLPVTMGAADRVHIQLSISSGYQTGITAGAGTIYPQVNGISVVGEGVPISGRDGMIGTVISFDFIHRHEGLEYTVGYSCAMNAGVPNLSIARAKAIIEPVRL